MSNLCCGDISKAVSTFLSFGPGQQVVRATRGNYYSESFHLGESGKDILFGARTNKLASHKNISVELVKENYGDPENKEEIENHLSLIGCSWTMPVGYDERAMIKRMFCREARELMIRSCLAKLKAREEACADIVDGQL